MTEEILYKNRSSIACLSDALKLMNNNVMTIIRRCWPYMLATIILSAITTTVTLNTIINGAIIVNGICVGVLSIVTIIPLGMLIGRVISMLSECTFRDATRRSVIVLLLVVGFAVIIGLAYVGIGYCAGVLAMKYTTVLKYLNTIIIILFALLTVAGIVAAIPFVYFSMKYIHGKTTLKNIWKDYRTGMHYFFYILGTVALTTFICLIIGFVFNIPITILTRAAVASSASTLIGDISDLPGNFPVLVFAAALLASIAATLLLIWETLVARYIYGTTEKRLEG